MEGTMNCSANYTPLSPISFLERSAIVYRDRISVVYENVKYTWHDTFQRCLRLAASLTQLGLLPGDVVAVLAPNVPQMYELHFGVPMAGAVLCTLNIRHNSVMISALLAHSEAKIMFIDNESLEIARRAYNLLSQKGLKLPISVLISDSDTQYEFTASNNFSFSHFKYDNLISMGRDDFAVIRPKEQDPIALNYTSGTTSNPKGVVYSHRGAYLNSLASVILSEMGSMPVYLWTVPMFHCNGWCFAWAVAAQGGTNICLRNITAQNLFEDIFRHKVTHMSAAPTVLNMIVNSPLCNRTPLPGKVSVLAGGAPPPPTVIFQMQALGFHLIHSYGLTETFGPATICTWKPEWDSLPLDVQAKIKSRQGVQHLGMEVDVKDSHSMESVPSDGKTLGEVMFRGNTVMSGYWRDMKATEEAFSGGWFHSGDLGVRHADGYIELKDRAKDIIISGGENISTIEVESVLFAHPAVLEAAIVGRPDDHWGESPCAFVKLKDKFDVGANEIISFCRERLPHYMAPKTVVFQELPKTSTGKIQKFMLKEKAKSMGSLPKKNPSRM